MRKILQGLTISLLTIVALLLILEIGLRITGSFYRKELSVAKTEDPSAFLIYCFGDSFTYGIGSENKKGYPEQLQELCNQKHPSKNIKIVNFGIPGSNSRQAFHYFKHVLNSRDYAKPNIVIIMTGMNDWWNIADNNAVLSGWTCHPVLARLYMLLLRSRVFKLFTLGLARHPSAPPTDFYAQSVIADGDDPEARNKLGSNFLGSLSVVFEQNLNDLVDLARNSGVDILFSEYPRGFIFYTSLKRISKIRKVARIRNERRFKKLLAEDRPGEYLAASCSYSHPNARGYAEMAAETLVTLEKQWKKPA